MTNQKYLKSFEMVDMLEAMNRNILNYEVGCVIDAITGEYGKCPNGVPCRECIEAFLKAEKEGNE